MPVSAEKWEEPGRRPIIAISHKFRKSYPRKFPDDSCPAAAPECPPVVLVSKLCRLATTALPPVWGTRESGRMRTPGNTEMLCRSRRGEQARPLRKPVGRRVEV